MLNVYNKYENPAELPGYEERNPILRAIGNFTYEGEDAYHYSEHNLTGRELKLLEENPQYILRSGSKTIFKYIEKVLHWKRWTEAEPVIISKGAKEAYRYAVYAVKGRWLEAEGVIMSDPEMAFAYAERILSKDKDWIEIPGHENGRWPEAEGVIMRDPIWAIYYALQVIKGRFEAAEKYIKEDPKLWNKYNGFFKVED